MAFSPDQTQPDSNCEGQRLVSASRLIWTLCWLTQVDHFMCGGIIFMTGPFLFIPNIIRRIIITEADVYVNFKCVRR